MEMRRCVGCGHGAQASRERRAHESDSEARRAIGFRKKRPVDRTPRRRPTLLPALSLPRPREIASSRTPRAGPRRAPGCAVRRKYVCTYILYAPWKAQGTDWIEGGYARQACVRAYIYLRARASR